MRSVVIAIGCLIFAVLGTAASQAGLEDVAEGNFKATGTVRVNPDAASERLFCKLSGRNQGDEGFLVSGRCATATNSLPIKLHIGIIEKGRRYRLTSEIDRPVRGFDATNDYIGHVDGNSIVFVADVQIDDKAYSSRFVITTRNDDIERIVETVTDKISGEAAVLIDIKVRRQ